MFGEAGFFGLLFAELGLVGLSLCATVWVVYRLAVTAGMPSEATGEREPQCKA